MIIEQFNYIQKKVAKNIAVTCYKRMPMHSHLFLILHYLHYLPLLHLFLTYTFHLAPDIYHLPHLHLTIYLHPTFIKCQAWKATVCLLKEPLFLLFHSAVNDCNKDFVSSISLFSCLLFIQYFDYPELKQRWTLDRRMTLSFFGFLVFYMLKAFLDFMCMKVEVPLNLLF